MVGTNERLGDGRGASALPRYRASSGDVEPWRRPQGGPFGTGDVSRQRALEGCAEIMAEEREELKRKGKVYVGL